MSYYGDFIRNQLPRQQILTSMIMIHSIGRVHLYQLLECPFRSTDSWNRFYHLWQSLLHLSVLLFIWNHSQGNLMPKKHPHWVFLLVRCMESYNWGKILHWKMEQWFVLFYSNYSCFYVLFILDCELYFCCLQCNVYCT